MQAGEAQPTFKFWFCGLCFILIVVPVSVSCHVSNMCSCVPLSVMQCLIHYPCYEKLECVMGKMLLRVTLSNCCLLNLFSLFHAGYVLVMSHSGQDDTPSSFNLDCTIFNTQSKIIFNFFVCFSLLHVSVMSTTFVQNSFQSDRLSWFRDPLVLVVCWAQLRRS